MAHAGQIGQDRGGPPGERGDDRGLSATDLHQEPCQGWGVGAQVKSVHGVRLHQAPP